MIPTRFGVAALVGLGLGACFNPPGGPVLFSCEPDGSSACPPGYECRADACCHDVDTPDGADENACRLAPPQVGTESENGTGTASESGATDTGTADTEPSSGSASDTADADSTTAGPDDASGSSGSSSDDASGSSTTAAT